MKTSIARKILMALSGFFLLLFLLQHLLINSMSVVSESSFNSVSHFMGTNTVVQFVLQPVLAFGVIFHLSMGMYLEAQNTKARKNKYARNNGAASSTWMSRNMLITGIMILLFLGLHFYDFWIPEINTKYIVGDMSGLNAHGGMRYWEELHHKFADITRLALYCLSFIFLSLHLMHGFQSAFQSVGFRHGKYTPLVQKLGNVYAVLVPLGYVIVAVYHYVTQ
jgi:succinate dehydrogenase / fumarate reductase cytochrome b subunit